MSRDPRFDILFEPVRIGPVTSPNRFFQVPHCTGMGFQHPDTLNHMRETKALSKKFENHAYAVALQVMYYNFVRLHKTLWVTPAMAAGVTDRMWELADIVVLVKAEQDRRRGPYMKHETA